MKLTKHNHRLTIKSTRLANELMQRGYKMQIKRQCGKDLYIFKVDASNKIMQDIDSINRKIYYGDSNDREEWGIRF